MKTDEIGNRFIGAGIKIGQWLCTAQLYLKSYILGTPRPILSKFGATYYTDFLFYNVKITKSHHDHARKFSKFLIPSDTFVLQFINREAMPLSKQDFAHW